MYCFSNWKDDLAAGKKGEAFAFAVLSTLGYEVKDVSNDNEYQKKDIDCIATKGNEVMQVEVKADSKVNRTGNIVIELTTNIASGKKGWFNITQASHIFIVDVVNHAIHAVRTEELKKLYKAKKNLFKHLIQKQVENGSYYKEAEIALIPLAEIKQLPHYNYITEELLQ